MKVAIVGGPNSGKTALACALCEADAETCGCHGGATTALTVSAMAFKAENAPAAQVFDVPGCVSRKALAAALRQTDVVLVACDLVAAVDHAWQTGQLLAPAFASACRWIDGFAAVINAVSPPSTPELCAQAPPHASINTRAEDSALGQALWPPLAADSDENARRHDAGTSEPGGNAFVTPRELSPVPRPWNCGCGRLHVHIVLTKARTAALDPAELRGLRRSLERASAARWPALHVSVDSCDVRAEGGGDVERLRAVLEEAHVSRRCAIAPLACEAPPAGPGTSEDGGSVALSAPKSPRSPPAPAPRRVRRRGGCAQASRGESAPCVIS